MTNSKYKRGFGIYLMSDAESRAAWTGETIEQAAAAIAQEARQGLGLISPTNSNAASHRQSR